MLATSVICWSHEFPCINEISKNVEGENRHILWTAWDILIKVSGKPWHLIIFKVANNQGFTLSLESNFFSEKPQKRGLNLSPAFLGLKNKIYKCMNSISKNVYINKYDDIVNKYNNTYHSTIKMKPADVKSSTYIDPSKEMNDIDPKFKILLGSKVLKIKHLILLT